MGKDYECKMGAVLFCVCCAFRHAVLLGFCVLALGRTCCLSFWDVVCKCILHALVVHFGHTSCMHQAVRSLACSIRLCSCVCSHFASVWALGVWGRLLPSQFTLPSKGSDSQKDIPIRMLGWDGLKVNCQKTFHCQVLSGAL